MPEPLLKVEHLSKVFQVSGSFLFEKKQFVHAVDSVSFEISEGEVLGLVGESGSGKTTVGRLVVRLIEPTGGRIIYRDRMIAELYGREMKQLRRELQIIFQDPYDSLNPRMKVLDIVQEPLIVHGLAQNRAERIDMVTQSLKDVGLGPPEEFLRRYPHQLSGGQRQRVAISRALILHPKLIVADEPVSMLDVSIRSDVLNLMRDLKDKYDLSYLFITHDLAVARYVSERLAVMYLGKLVEVGETRDVIDNPRHPYTHALLSAVPRIDSFSSQTERTIPVRGEPPKALQVPIGCRFNPRCPLADQRCRDEEPHLVEMEGQRWVACHSPVTAGRRPNQHQQHTTVRG